MKEVILTMVLPNTEWQNALIVTDGIAVETRLSIVQNVDRDWTGVNSMEELKKCPFCGGEAILKIHYGFDEKVISAFVYCEECGVATRRCALETTAIGKWNRRVEE